MAIDFSNIAGNIRDREDNRPTRPTQQQQNVYQQAANTMREAGIGSLSGRVTSDDRGQRASEILEEAGFDIGTPGNMATVGFDRPTQGKIIETAGDPLKRSIVSNILRGKQPRETGIFGIDFGNLSLPTINPALGAIQGFQNTNQVLEKLSKGSELNSKDKITLINLRNNLAGDDFTNLFVKYAEDNDAFLNDMFANFQKEYGKIVDKVTDPEKGDFPDYSDAYFKRMDEMNLGDTIKTMAGDLTGTRDTKGVITLEAVTDSLGPEGLAYLKATDPQTYYRLRPNDRDLANESFVSTGDKVADRRFNAKIMEARAEAMNRQSRQDANMGIMAASPALPGLPVTGPATVITPTTPTTNPVLTPVPVGGVTPTTTGITPFNINQFYASLPQYTQQGIMAPNLSRFTDALRMFPGMA